MVSWLIIWSVGRVAALYRAERTLPRQAILSLPLAAPLVAVAKTGEGARFGTPSASEADAALGSRADSYGDDSRENSVYRKNIQVDESSIQAKRQKLASAKDRLETKLESALEKKQWAKVVDSLNAEMYSFKSLLSDVTKARQDGRVCLVDPSQRGGFIPKDFDPDDCPLQLVQVAILQDVNDLFRIASSTRDTTRAVAAYTKFKTDLDRFLAQSEASPNRSPEGASGRRKARLDLAY